jgi:hypothetical protein
MRYETTPTRTEIALSRLSASPLDQKHLLMDNHRACLAKFDTERKYRSANQRMIQQKMSAALCPLVYGVDLCKKYEHAIKLYNNFPSLKQEVFYSAPRRGGKSEALAQWAAATAFCIPDVEMCIFSIAKRSAGKSGLLGKIIDYLHELGLKKSDIKERGDEDFVFEINGNKRKIHAYPGSVHTYVTRIICIYRFVFLSPSLTGILTMSLVVEP